jgi:hypothetical protein
MCGFNSSSDLHNHDCQQPQHNDASTKKPFPDSATPNLFILGGEEIELEIRPNGKVRLLP